MARGQSDRSTASGGGSQRLRRSTNQARVTTRFLRLPSKLQALKVGQQQFTDDQGRFDLDVWEQAFNNNDPAVILTVHGVTGIYISIVNHLAEMLLAAAERGLAVVNSPAKPTAPALFDAIAADGGFFTENQVEVLKDLVWARNELEHSSPTISAEEVYKAIVMLQKTQKRLLQSYVNWLKENDLMELLTR